MVAGLQSGVDPGARPWRGASAQAPPLRIMPAGEEADDNPINQATPKSKMDAWDGLPARTGDGVSPEEVTERAIREANRLYGDDPRASLRHLEVAIAADPLCYEALTMAGELYSLWWEELGLPQKDASEI